MTMLQFRERFKKLLQDAVEAGLDVDDVGQMAESILESDWGRDDEDGNE